MRIVSRISDHLSSTWFYCFDRRFRFVPSFTHPVHPAPPFDGSAWAFTSAARLTDIGPLHRHLEANDYDVSRIPIEQRVPGFIDLSAEHSPGGRSLKREVQAALLTFASELWARDLRNLELAYRIPAEPSVDSLSFFIVRVVAPVWTPLAA